MNLFKPTFLSIPLATSLLVISSSSFAAPLPNADDIVKKINARNEGIAVSRDLTMTMTDKRGKTRVRETKGMRKYYGSGSQQEKRSVIFYLKPTNIKDTAFLTYDYPQANKNDDQWLYLPALRKVRRISASDRGDSFLGTDFSYEDIKLETRVSITDYHYKTIGEGNIGGHHCFKIEGTPKNQKIAKELGYSKTESCIDDKIWMSRQTKSWDLTGKPLKTIKNSDIKQVQGIWTQHRIDVSNHKTGHRTTFVFKNVDYKSGVEDSVFTQNSIRRGL